MNEPYRIQPPREGDDDIVVVSSYPAVLGAEMAQEYLKSHGITAFTNESASFNPIMNEAFGGVRVLVKSADLGRARSLLAQLEKPGDSDEDDGEVGEVRCPRCELAYCFYQTAFEGRSARAIDPILVLLSPLFSAFSRKRWRCSKCFYVWDDRDAGPKKMTPLAPDDPRPVFRLRRVRGGLGLLVGLMLMTLLGAVAMAPGMHPAVMFVTLLLPFIGYIIGHSIGADYCSAPGCRAELLPGVETCPVCRGVVAGSIRAAHEHYIEAAQIRRELAEIHARDEARRAKKKQKRLKPASNEPPL